MPWRRYEVRPCEGGREKGYVYEDSDGDEIESKDRVLWGVPYVGRVRVFQKGKKRHATGADDAGCEQPRNDPEVGEPECIRRPRVLRQAFLLLPQWRMSDLSNRIVDLPCSYDRVCKNMLVGVDLCKLGFDV